MKDLRPMPTASLSHIIYGHGSEATGPELALLTMSVLEQRNAKTDFQTVYSLNLFKENKIIILFLHNTKNLRGRKVFRIQL